MKLKSLSEDDILKDISKKFAGRGYFMSSDPSLGQMMGWDQGSRLEQNVSMPSGIPAKPRHRRFFSLIPPNTQI